MSAPRVPLPERMAKWTRKEESCWVWTGNSSNGYGYVSDGKKRRRAHRVAYELEYGPIPAGMFIDHRCHTTLCVRPSHLRAVTPKQNVEHMAGPYRTNTSGYLGVSKHGKRWTGTVDHYGTRHRIPTFDTPEEAAEAVKALRLSLFTHNDKDRTAA